MFRSTRTIFLTTLLALVAAAPLWAVDIAGPLSFDDLRQLRRDGKAAKEIVALAQQRRLSFVVDENTERRLRTMGFRRSMIEALKSIEAVKSIDEPAAGQAVAAGDRPDGSTPAARDEAPPAADPAVEAAHNAFAARVMHINAASGLKLVVVPSANVTLIADQVSAKKYLPLIQQIESTIRRTFPAPLGGGADRRSTFIVLLRSTTDYQRWVTAMYAVNERSGYRKAEPHELKATLMAAGSLPTGIALIDLQKTGTWERRSIAFDMGYLFMQSATGGKAPAALLAGFGSMSEATLDGNPSIVLGAVDYAQQHLPQSSGNRWIRLLQRQVAAQRMDSVEQLFVYGFASLEEIHYAEAWSLVQLLATDPPRLARLAAAIRDGKEPLPALHAIYEVDAQTLARRWNGLIESVR